MRTSRVTWTLTQLEARVAGLLRDRLMRNLSSPLTLETLLVLACVRRDLDAERIQDLVKRGPDWHAVLRGVERWSLAPLVYTSLRQADATGQVPDPVAERLRHLYRRQTVHWIDQREVLRETLQRFSEASLPAIVLKGAALATLVYPSPTLRPTRQVDLLVRQRDAARVEALLKSMRDATASPAAAGVGAGADRYPGLEHRRRRRIRLARRTHDMTLVQKTGRQPFISRSRISGSERDPLKSSWWRHSCSAPRTFSCTSPWILRLRADSWAMPGRYAISGKRADDSGMRSTGVKLLRRRVLCQTVKPLYYALRWARELVGAQVPYQALAELRGKFRQVPLEDRLIAAAARQAILPDQAVTPIPSVAKLAPHLLKHHRAKEGVTMAFRHLGRVCGGACSDLASRPSLAGRSALESIFSVRPSAIAIVMPVYRPRLDDPVLATVDRAIAILQRGDWHLVAPMSLETSFYEKRYGKAIVRFPDVCLGSLQKYNRLLLTDEFYATFAQYEYMLVIQDDVYVLRDDLAYWQARQFDYIGAPWPMGIESVLRMSHKPGIHGHTVTAYVGNGGFSLRRIAACRQLLAEFAEEAAWFRKHDNSEDMFFAVFGQFSQQFTLPKSARGCRVRLGVEITAHARSL